VNDAPNLSAALSGPQLNPEKPIVKAKPAIENWLRGKWKKYATLFYLSVNLRNSGFKLALVDTNLYPGGFNSLNSDLCALCVHATMTAIEKVCAEPRGVLLIPLAFRRWLDVPPSSYSANGCRRIGVPNF
jgi:glutamate--cysteine ligase